MTVEEYNKFFYPKVSKAEGAIRLMDSAINHADISDRDKAEVRRIFEIYNWNDETKDTILTALEYYREHEGIGKLEFAVRKALSQEESQQELKKCPFCGGEAVIKADSKNYGFIIWCQCKNGNCNARTVGYCPDTNHEDDTLENIESCKNKAVEAWNRRADDGKTD